jgi:benzaldehyde dehydrogenase (NAD)
VAGDPKDPATQLGPLASEEHYKKVCSYLDGIEADGGIVRTGGLGEGWTVLPTVVEGAPPDARVCREEIFGPVVTVTPFGTDDEAVALANDTEYGLVAGVLARDVVRARRIADRLHAGAVHINDQTIMHEVFAPMGGMGVSGNGSAYGALTNADLFTEWQWLTTRDELAHYPF